MLPSKCSTIVEYGQGESIDCQKAGNFSSYFLCVYHPHSRVEMVDTSEIGYAVVCCRRNHRYLFPGWCRIVFSTVAVTISVSCIFGIVCRSQPVCRHIVRKRACKRTCAFIVFANDVMADRSVAGEP